MQPLLRGGLYGNRGSSYTHNKQHNYMKETRKFPNGDEVYIVSKQKVLDCIDENITDKEIALEVVTRCEQLAAKYLIENRWVSIPHIGNIRIPKHKLDLYTEDTQNRFKEAYNTLPTEEYIAFKISELTRINKKEYVDRHFNYVLSKNIKLYEDYYKKIKARRNETAALVAVYCLNFVHVVTDEYIETSGVYDVL